MSNFLYEFKSNENCDSRIVNRDVAHKLHELMWYIKILLYCDGKNQWCHFHREPDMSRNSKFICRLGSKKYLDPNLNGGQRNSICELSKKQMQGTMHVWGNYIIRQQKPGRTDHFFIVSKFYRLYRSSALFGRKAFSLILEDNITPAQLRLNRTGGLPNDS